MNTSIPSPDDAYYAERQRQTEALAASLGVSVRCAEDVEYLRTRSRHTPELEAELIALYAAGTPPAICDFGVTAESQAFIASVCDEVRQKYEN